MLNPDGVVYGNYRCSLVGQDLNREFANPHRKLHPTVWHLKQLLHQHKADLYLDFHGHSRKEGVFFYGNQVLDRPQPADTQLSQKHSKQVEIALLPRLCCLASTDFRFDQCTFRDDPGKQGTGRVVALKQFGIEK